VVVVVMMVFVVMVAAAVLALLLHQHTPRVPFHFSLYCAAAAVL
jgi:hypothetical protein